MARLPGQLKWGLLDRSSCSSLNRPGFPPNPPEDRIDFEEHGARAAERLRPGDHLCGHSYGAIVSLFAAEVADELRSLILIEPPVFGVRLHIFGEEPLGLRVSQTSKIRKTPASSSKPAVCAITPSKGPSPIFSATKS
jgi:pimeloyl-ACP methyl ester carboxylesterase